jgi:hypothetical protein
VSGDRGSLKMDKKDFGKAYFKETNDLRRRLLALLNEIKKFFSKFF